MYMQVLHLFINMQFVATFVWNPGTVGLIGLWPIRVIKGSGTSTLLGLPLGRPSLVWKGAVHAGTVWTQEKVIRVIHHRPLQVFLLHCRFVLA